MVFVYRPQKSQEEEHIVRIVPEYDCAKCSVSCSLFSETHLSTITLAE